MIGNSNFIDIARFEKVKEIGMGGFGKVYIVKDTSSGELYAAKISLEEFSKDNEEGMTDLIREVNNMAKLNHPNILKFIGYSPFNFKKNKHKPIIITEYLKNNTLSYVLDFERKSRALKGWDQTQKLKCILGIASGMSYLHENRIIHRDLKSLNILMDDDLSPRISDFGFSKILHQNQESMTTKSKTAIKGTNSYIAPEIWTNCLYSFASDVYAFAMIVYEIMTLSVPFEKVSSYEIPEKVIAGERPEFKYYVDEPYKNLIERCWSQDPSERPSFTQIVNELKTNLDYIIPGVDENEYIEYIEFIDKYKATFDPNKQIILRKTYKESSKFTPEMKIKRKTLSSSLFSLISGEIKPVNFFTEDSFSVLDKNCQMLVTQAQNDPNTQLVVGICLIEGTRNFPNNITLGVQYLEESINRGCIGAVLYLCDLLEKGEIIQQNLLKAENYLKKFLNKNDSRVQYLYGKVMKKLNKYAKAREYFIKSAKNGNSDSMYEYGIMLFYGEGGKCNIYEAIGYFIESRENGNKNSSRFLEIYEEMKKSRINCLPLEIQHFIMSKAVYSGIKSNLLINFNQVQKLYNNNESIISLDFITILFKFNDVLIELEYPHKIFKPIYDMYKIIDKNKGNKIGLHIIVCNRILSPIDKINDYLFKDCKSLERITIPSSIKRIGKYSFAGCSFLQQIEIPESVESIDEYAFDGCSSISQITIPSSVLKIGDYCFKNCSSLTKITILSPIKSIKMHTFWNCTSLTRVLASNAIIEKIIDYANDIYFHMDKYPYLEESCRMFLIAANNGYVYAMMRYGNMLEAGVGSEINLKEASRYYKMAGDLGYATGIINYVTLLDKGIGAPDDINETCRYFKMAADMENEKGMINYAIMLENGTGVKMDKEEACFYFKKAADKGDVDANYHYGRMLENGIGIMQNYDEAIKYYKIASDKGHNKAIEAYKRLTQ